MRILRSSRDTDSQINNLYREVAKIGNLLSVNDKVKPSDNIGSLRFGKDEIYARLNGKVVKIKTEESGEVYQDNIQQGNAPYKILQWNKTNTAVLQDIDIPHQSMDEEVLIADNDLDPNITIYFIKSDISDITIDIKDIDDGSQLIFKNIGDRESIEIVDTGDESVIEGGSIEVLDKEMVHLINQEGNKWVIGGSSRINHNHDDRYSLLDHNHDSEYSPIEHTHVGVVYLSDVWRINVDGSQNLVFEYKDYGVWTVAETINRPT